MIINLQKYKFSTRKELTDKPGVINIASIANLKVTEVSMVVHSLAARSGTDSNHHIANI